MKPKQKMVADKISMVAETGSDALVVREITQQGVLLACLRCCRCAISSSELEDFFLLLLPRQTLLLEQMLLPPGFLPPRDDAMDVDRLIFDDDDEYDDGDSQFCLQGNAKSPGDW